MREGSAWEAELGAIALIAAVDKQMKKRVPPTVTQTVSAESPKRKKTS